MNKYTYEILGYRFSIHAYDDVMAYMQMLSYKSQNYKHLFDRLSPETKRAYSFIRSYKMAPEKILSIYWDKLLSMQDFLDRMKKQGEIKIIDRLDWQVEELWIIVQEMSQLIYPVPIEVKDEKGNLLYSN